VTAASSLWARVSIIGKSVLGEMLDGIHRERPKKLYKLEGMPQSMLFHLLWRSLNGPVVNVLTITAFLAILERRSNGQDSSNGHISSSW
jgi:hypothetical protein